VRWVSWETSRGPYACVNSIAARGVLHQLGLSATPSSSRPFCRATSANSLIRTLRIRAVLACTELKLLLRGHEIFDLRKTLEQFADVRLRLGEFDAAASIARQLTLQLRKDREKLILDIWMA
jgi:hypothetical protein